MERRRTTKEKKEKKNRNQTTQILARENVLISMMIVHLPQVLCRVILIQTMLVHGRRDNCIRRLGQPVQRNRRSSKSTTKSTPIQVEKESEPGPKRKKLNAPAPTPASAPAPVPSAKKPRTSTPLPHLGSQFFLKPNRFTYQGRDMISCDLSFSLRVSNTLGCRSPSFSWSGEMFGASTLFAGESQDLDNTIFIDPWCLFWTMHTQVAMV